MGLVSFSPAKYQHLNIKCLLNLPSESFTKQYLANIIGNWGSSSDHNVHWLILFAYCAMPVNVYIACKSEVWCGSSEVGPVQLINDKATNLQTNNIIFSTNATTQLYFQIALIIFIFNFFLKISLEINNNKMYFLVQTDERIKYFGWKR